MPDKNALKHFDGFSAWGEVIREIRVPTRRLDDISEVETVDFLKIDVQGSELSIFRNGRDKLSKSVAVHTEVSFVPLYVGQPVFGEIDLELRSLGFVPHALAEVITRLIAPTTNPKDKFSGLNQLVEADIVYVRDFLHADQMQPEQLKHLAMVAHHCYSSYDLVINCLHHLSSRGAIAADARNRYLSVIQSNQ